MSHTIEPVKEDNQQLPSNSPTVNQNSSRAEDGKMESESLLSDADYEFLFNQLLEGIAHGWHDRRIIKFFQQLGDRGKPEAWVAWLERFTAKGLNLPWQSRRHLGTMMIRLGELTQSAMPVQPIGKASNRLGRELLFGNTEELIWEYAGPDLPKNTIVPELTTENIAQRLPEDFTELEGTKVEETVTEESPHQPNAKGQFSSEETPPLILENPPVEQPQVEETNTVIQELADLESINLQASSAEAEFPLISADFSSEFEFATPTNQSQNSELSTPSTPVIADSSVTPLETPDPVAIDLEQVMNLIQEDEDLAQEIAEKLNNSLTNLEQPAIIETSVETSVAGQSADLTNYNLDQSSIELIEGWFNLGLKQVSAGEFEGAIASWEKALKINPHLSEAWHNRGSALGRLGKYEAAVDSFQKALAIDPNNYQAWNDRAHALYQLQNWLAAADSWSNAIKIMPANHLFWYNRGCALEQLESWAESIASYEKSLEIKPDFQPARARYTNLIADNSRSN